MNRAYSLLEVKAVDEEKRSFEGMATTVTADRMQDVVEPKGAEFKLPLPFLYQHAAGHPIGQITSATVTSKGIRVAGYVENLPDAPPSLRERLDVAWAEMKSKLVRGLSIGFRPLENAYMEDTGGYRFLRWEWLELSLVTIPANAEATILSVKQYDARSLAALGRNAQKGVSLLTNPPGASGQVAAHRGSVKLIPR